jgi:hypothetical protein
MFAMDEAVGQKHVYTVTGDPEVMRDFNRAHVRFRWKMWLKYAVRNGGTTVIAAAAAMMISRVFDGPPRLGLGFVVGLVVGFLVGALNVYSYAERAIFEAAKEQEGEVWTCEMDGERWTFTRSDGTRTSIPWELMSLKFDHPDCWHVEYGKQSVVIMRRPLRDANLEEEFKRRAKFGETPPASS